MSEYIVRGRDFINLILYIMPLVVWSLIHKSYLATSCHEKEGRRRLTWGISPRIERSFGFGLTQYIFPLTVLVRGRVMKGVL